MNRNSTYSVRIVSGDSESNISMIHGRSNAIKIARSVAMSIKRSPAKHFSVYKHDSLDPAPFLVYSEVRVRGKWTQLYNLMNSGIIKHEHTWRKPICAYSEDLQ